MTDPITISLSLWDSGALPNLLRREIECVEGRVRRGGGGDDAAAYLQQLQGCLKAIEAARQP